MKDKEMVKNSSLTIADIARMADVSKSTVSRALKDSPLIATETRERIQDIAKENHFTLNALAQSLSLQKSYTIAYVTHCFYTDYSVADLFNFEIISGINGALNAKGYDLLMLQVNPYQTDWAHKYLDASRVDGFILLTTSRKQNHVKALLEAGAPFVIWGVPWPELHCPSVTGDNLNGGRLATRYLIESGRKKIGFIGGPFDELEVQGRYHGYEMEMQHAGREIDQRLVASGDYSMTSGAQALDELLERVPDMDAVVVCSDLMAIAVMDAIRKHGRRIPDDVAVVGYDDLSIAQLANPPLTTISQHVSKAGSLLVETLLQYIGTGNITNVTVPVELIKRQSA